MTAHEQNVSGEPTRSNVASAVYADVMAEDAANCQSDTDAALMQDDIPVVISSLVVETAPEYTQDVADKIAQIAGAEVHEINGYKIVVTIEASTVDESADIASSFIKFTGVIGINVVYCNFEDDKTIYPEGI